MECAKKFSPWKKKKVEVVVVERENACRQCGKRFASMRALFGHMRHHSSSKSKKKKNNNPPKLVICCTTTTTSTADEESKQRFKKKISDVEEAAVCLMKLSSGISNWDEFIISLQLGKGIPPQVLKEYAAAAAADDDDHSGIIILNNNKKQEEEEEEEEEEEVMMIRREYKCKTCDKIFFSHRALGGHRRGHNTYSNNNKQ